MSQKQSKFKVSKLEENEYVIHNLTLCKGPPLFYQSAKRIACKMIINEWILFFSCTVL